MNDIRENDESMILLLHEKDNTVTALADLTKGQTVFIHSQSGQEKCTLTADIPYAHKFSRTFIPKGTDVIKYGEVIGVASADIDPGQHVHVHNVDGKRA